MDSPYQSKRPEPAPERQNPPKNAAAQRELDRAKEIVARWKLD